MKVIIYGASGMVGQGVLRECLAAADVSDVRVVLRAADGRIEARLHETVMDDVSQVDTVAAELSGYDACFFCLGVSSSGMAEAQYVRLTHDLTLSVAKRLAALNPQMTFVYVSGAGTDSSERGRVMWARVKGRTENALLRLPFKTAAMFRPGVIQPLHGIRSKTFAYQLVYSLARPLLPLLRRMLPNHILTTESMGRAMLAVARNGAPKPVLETRDIAALGL